MVKTVWPWQLAGLGVAVATGGIATVQPAPPLIDCTEWLRRTDQGPRQCRAEGRLRRKRGFGSYRVIPEEYIRDVGMYQLR